MKSHIHKYLVPVLCASALSVGCTQKNPDPASSGKYPSSDFVMYTLNDALYFSFDENDELKLDGKEQTDFDCSFLQTYFKESDDYWYSVTSEKAALERIIVQIDKDSLKLSLSDTVSGGGFAAAGVYNNTFIHDISSYGNYQLVQHDTSLNK